MEQDSQLREFYDFDHLEAAYLARTSPEGQAKAFFKQLPALKRELKDPQLSMSINNNSIASDAKAKEILGDQLLSAAQASGRAELVVSKPYQAESAKTYNRQYRFAIFTYNYSVVRSVQAYLLLVTHPLQERLEPHNLALGFIMPSPGIKENWSFIGYQSGTAEVVPLEDGLKQAAWDEFKFAIEQLQAADAIKPIEDDAPVDELNLDPRARNCLSRAGVNTIGELCIHDEGRLNAIPNLGPKTLEHIVARLATRDRQLASPDSR